MSLHILAGFLFTLLPATASNAPLRSHLELKPLLVIWSNPGYPDPGQVSISGLVTAVWADGYMIRARDKTDIGKVYEEGFSSPKDFTRFTTFLTRSKTLATPNSFGVALHAPWLTISIFDGKKTHKWEHSDPDENMRAIEKRAWNLPFSAKPASLSTEQQDRLRP